MPVRQTAQGNIFVSFGWRKEANIYENIHIRLTIIDVAIFD